MTIEFGVMQGRLTPKYQQQYQSHPQKHWQSEFFIAKELGFELIEFIVDSWSLDANPLMSDDGINELKAVIQDSGVRVKTLCADVFMDLTFIQDSDKEARAVLIELMHAATHLGIRDIVIPCVDRSSLLKDPSFVSLFASRITDLCKLAYERGLRINLETDLPPSVFEELLNLIGREYVWVNYDSGNSASLGFEACEEFSCYGDRISNIHLKDRVLGGASVPLGEGNANFETVLTCIKDMAFQGPLILQAARAENFVDDVVLLRKQFNWIKEKWQSV